MSLMLEFREQKLASHAMVPTGERTFFAVSALLFVVTVAGTITWCRSMSAMGGMQMPGGWTMSMTWMQMPGQSWVGAAVSFLGMWTVMMIAMMLPCLIPQLRQYRQAVIEATPTRLGWLTTLVGAGYFFAWTAFGMVAYATGFALTSFEMHQLAVARAVPVAGGVIILGAGVLQFYQWKARHLACCFECGRAIPNDARVAWRHGLHLGVHCSCCCAGLMAVLLVLGVMNLGAMAVIAVLVNVERLTPGNRRVARAVGIIVIVAGLLVMLRAATLA